VAGSTAATQVGTLQLSTFINSAGLQAQGEKLYVEPSASGNATANAPGANGAGMLTQKYVETSHVNVVEELVNIIQTQRAYEINSKAITTSDQMLQKLTQM
ncbi:flagellar hook-basal body complex protein, partial [Methylotenera sp.]|uniref:flagellar hook-basal body complex protein n=1 Tax=Methylotenera sp. TaxID=2051956 RepID=UPI002736A534